jgi:integrase/recombinase XerD
MNIADAITSFLDHRESQNLSTGTLTFYRHHLYDWKNWCDSQHTMTIEAVTIAIFRGYMKHLQERPCYQNHRYRKSTKERLSAGSLDSAWRSLRAFWNFLETDNVLTEKQQDYFRSGRLPRPKVEQSIRPIYPPDLFEQMIAAARSTDAEEHYRDHTILFLLMESGIRNAELCSLTDEMIDPERRRAQIRGKGGRYRWVYWGEDTAYHLHRYLEFRRGESGGPLFRGFGSRNMGGAITPDSVRSLFKRLSKRAGVTLPKSAPVHALRHTFARNALESGIDGLQLSQLMGHEDTDTTKRYVNESPDRLGEIHKRIKRRKSEQE